MASSNLLNLEQLLAPIPGDNPCGESLRWDAVWDEIATLRKPQTDAVTEAADAEADWGRVRDLAVDVLTRRTRDLMIAGWLTESLVQTAGFAGLRDGLRLLLGLVEEYWDGVHPEIGEDGDLDVRAAPLVWLSDPNGGARMPALLREIPLARAPQSTETFSWIYWNARFVNPQGENKAEADEKKERFESAVASTPREFYVDLYEDLSESRLLLGRLADAADSRLGDSAPGWSALRKALDEIEILVRRILNDKGGVPGESPGGAGDASAAPDQNGPADVATSDGRTPVVAGGPIRSRADAIASLEQAAEFFRRTEPHSPVADLVGRAVAWARQPLSDVLRDLIKDDKVLSQIGDMLGWAGKPDDKSKKQKSE
jgi:type VI secretion system protein ImpA